MQLLSDSSYFGERLGDALDGVARSLPIVLEDVTVREMDALLCMLDARYVNSRFKR